MLLQAEAVPKASGFHRGWLQTTQLLAAPGKWRWVLLAVVIAEACRDTV